MDEPNRREGFPDTQWILIDRLHGDDQGARAAALAQLSRIYWPAAFAYLRRTGLDAQLAEEITQSFFAEVVVERRFFECADRTRGDLRWLLVRALSNHRIDVLRRHGARNGHAAALSVETLEQQLRDAEARPQSDEFNRHWALAVIQEAMRRCESHFFSRGLSQHWKLFETRVLRPAIAMVAPPRLEPLATKCGFASAAEASSALHYVRRCFDSHLREVIAESGVAPGEIEAECRRLGAALEERG